MARRLVPFRTRMMVSLGLYSLLALALTWGLLAAYRRLSVTMLHGAYSQTLSVMAESVEDGLRSVRDLAVRIATNPDLQDRIEALNREQDTYQRAVRSGEIAARMVTASPPPYLAALYIVDRNGEVTASRLDYANLGAITDARTLADFRGSGEPYRWVYSATDPEVFLLFRRIRRVAELSLEDMGLVVLVLDKERFVRSVFKRRFLAELDIGILYDNSLVYVSKEDLDAETILDGLGDRGYGTISAAGVRYFATAIEPAESNLEYVCIVPHALLFGPLDSYNRIALLAYIGLLVAILLSAARVSQSVSSPVAHLASEMKKIESEDFSHLSLHLPARIRTQEVSTLYHEFSVMLKRIDSLIEENYRKQMLVQESRFRSLQAQINPHFLYNTLESINWLAQLNDQEVIASMVQALGDLLRASIGNKKPVIPLSEEIGLLRQYVLIQKLRYGARLVVEIELPEHLGETAVPRLTLQPLVENSIKYGLEASSDVCRIRVIAEEEGENTVIRVADNGPGMEEALVEKIEAGQLEPRGSGVGVKNIRDRLIEIYGEDCGLRIRSAPGEGAEVILAVPRLSVPQLTTAAGVGS